MALINCAECGRQISDQAHACPGCGAPVRRPTAATSASTDIPPRPVIPAHRSAMSQILIAGGVLAGIAVLLMIVAQFVEPPSKAEITAREAKSNKSFAIETCHERYAKEKEDPRATRGTLILIYSTCEKMEQDYRAEYGEDP